MSDNPRMPGHPSDIPSSRSSEGSSGSVPSGPSGYNHNIPSPPSPGPPSGNSQTRNIIIGAIATIFASTIVYYLTQYVNNRKSSEAASYPEKKEATTNAWRRYVTIDNIYYKNILSLSNDKELLKNLDNYEAETSAETDNFIKDAETLIKEKNIDKTFVAMVNRRLKRERESRDIAAKYYDTLNSIKRSDLSDEEKAKKSIAETTVFFQYAKTLFERAATEIEDLTKTLTETYATPFNPYDVMIYADYKKNISQPEAYTDEGEADSAANNIESIEAKKLVGNWDDRGNTISLQKNGNMSYRLNSGDTATGKWKIANNKLKIDALSSVTKLKTTWFFNLSNITSNSFTMKLSTQPFDVYNLVRVKNN
jgi:hypothetical protein